MFLGPEEVLEHDWLADLVATLDTVELHQLIQLEVIRYTLSVHGRVPVFLLRTHFGRVVLQGTLDAMHRLHRALLQLSQLQLLDQTHVVGLESVDLVQEDTLLEGVFVVVVLELFGDVLVHLGERVQLVGQVGVVAVLDQVELLLQLLYLGLVLVLALGGHLFEFLLLLALSALLDQRQVLQTLLQLHVVGRLVTRALQEEEQETLELVEPEAE